MSNQSSNPVTRTISPDRTVGQDDRSSRLTVAPELPELPELAALPVVRSAHPARGFTRAYHRLLWHERETLTIAEGQYRLTVPMLGTPPTDFGVRLSAALTEMWCDPAAAAGFLDSVGEAVIKPMIGVGSTRLVTAEDRTRLDELTRCPALFQERLIGPTLRIHVVGDRMVLALRIIAEGVDSRTGTKDFEEIELNPDEAAMMVRANRFLGLHYAAWDAIEGEDGRLRALDCNPGPYVMWLPAAARRTVFGNLARYLVRFAETGQ